jgi:hypothetical protein
MAEAIPDNAPQPQDRKKKKSAQARQAEVDGYIDIEQCGVPLRIPLGDKVPLTAYMAFKDDDEMRGTELLLGAEQWSAFLAANPTVGDFAEIGQKLTDVLGN